ncbi:MAG: GIY-YIG nuclease family protein [Gemmatimonadota bacterium]|nr:GIY-YIG nuclease family protein [Gemmatimonadota bacterium]MDE2830052.1 GIY-YIG nuclease family protein [Gemmatimonadota bacterium]MDE2954601.1 GIY-YIG nuclease family protein [Gemmatimonadota bacterium]
MNKTVKDRIYAFLEQRDTGVHAEVLASEALGLYGARGPIADKVVRAAVEDDSRFVCDRSGMWYLRPPGQGKTLREVSFFCFGLVPSADAEVYALAGRKVQMGGRETLFPMVQVRLDGREGILDSFAEGVSDAIPVGFQWSRMRRDLNRMSRLMMGKDVVDSGICLFRLGRRFCPDVRLHSVEDLASAMGMSFVSDRGAEGEASLQADILLDLLERCEEEGLNTIEAVTAALYPDPIPIHFDAYAFDEVFLSSLPELPGVYIMRDREGGVIYVGKAVNLRRRVGSYFARRSERPEKTQRILDRIWSMEVETVGSELEALLLESKLIALCQPEFNTQLDVHKRDAELGNLKNIVLILPSAELDCVELFCVVNDTSFFQVRANKDLCDWEVIERTLHEFYFLEELESDLETGDSFEILKSWMVAKRDAINWVDMDRSGSPENALRIVREYVQQCEDEDWEKISWRV